MTQHIRTNYEQLEAFGIDNVSGIVYSAGHLSIPQQGRQTSRLFAKPHSHSAVFNMFQNDILGTIIPFTQECVKVVAGTQTRLRKLFSLRRMHTNLRKGCVKDN